MFFHLYSTNLFILLFFSFFFFLGGGGGAEAAGSKNSPLVFLPYRTNNWRGNTLAKQAKFLH